MTETETEIETVPTTTTTDDWDAQLQALKTRFPKAKDSIVFAIHALQLNPEILLDDLKAQAKMHDIRVTAASVTAAQRLLAPTTATNGEAVGAAPKAKPTKPPRTRQRRSAQAPLDVEALIRATVGKVQAQGETEAERLRVAMRKAIAVLEAAVPARAGTMRARGRGSSVGRR